MRLFLPQTTASVSRPVAWLAAFLIGSILGLGLRLVSFLAGALILEGVGALTGHLVPLLPFLDPVYTHAAEQTLGVVPIQGLAVIAPFGDQLHNWLPNLFVPASRAHWSFVRLAVEPGS